MKIYAVTEGDYSDYRIIALTISEERAKHLAKIYEADIEEYEDAQEMPENPMWVYCSTWGDDCYLLGPYAEYEGKERVEDGGKTAYVRAEDEAHALKKARDMIARYKAESEGI